MLTEVRLGALSLSGVSVGGVYTSLHVPELGVIFDSGIAPRSFVGATHVFLSHGHADHVGGLATLLGIRGLNRTPPPHLIAPAEIAEDVSAALEAFRRMQGRGGPIECKGILPGEVVPLKADLSVRAFRTLHTIPSLGYEIFRSIPKLKPELAGASPDELLTLKAKGAPITDLVERPVLAYATDTLIDVLDAEPHLLKVPVLVLECTFLDERKTRTEAREKCHIHLEEIVERASAFENEHLVLMHFSQAYRPDEVRAILARALPPTLAARVTAFLPAKGPFPG